MGISLGAARPTGFWDWAPPQAFRRPPSGRLCPSVGSGDVGSIHLPSLPPGRQRPARPWSPFGLCRAPACAPAEMQQAGRALRVPAAACGLGRASSASAPCLSGEVRAVQELQGHVPAAGSTPGQGAMASRRPRAPLPSRASSPCARSGASSQACARRGLRRQSAPRCAGRCPQARRRERGLLGGEARGSAGSGAAGWTLAADGEDGQAGPLNLWSPRDHPLEVPAPPGGGPGLAGADRGGLGVASLGGRWGGEGVGRRHVRFPSLWAVTL